MKIDLLLLVCVIVSCCVVEVCQGGSLSKNFYKKTCPGVEQFVQNLTWAKTASDGTIPAKTIRMHFHDCIVRGCDGSVLLNSTANNSAEKDAVPNLTLGGFDFIDAVKAQVEQMCPGVVSCADILALVARDSVSFEFGKPQWEVLTGRRDGKVSLQSEALRDIPRPGFNFSALKQSFSSKGLTVHDLVVLSGAHTIGIGHCNFFSNRLYNFTGKGDQDPSLDPTYAALLKTRCKSLTDNTTIVPMDPTTPTKFDTSYYTNLRQNKGMFTSDAALLTDNGAAKLTKELLSTDDFMTEFGQSMKRMGAIGVLTGSSGEIRKICSVVNS